MVHPPGTPGTICPYSGVLGDDSDFTHPDDIAAAKEVVAYGRPCRRRGDPSRHVSPGSPGRLPATSF